MRDSIQSRGWYIRRTHDVPALAAFYRDVVGLPVLHDGRGMSMHWAGETTVFEIIPGGTPPPVYTDRIQAPCVPILRVHGIQSTIDRLKAAGVQFINDFDREHNRLAYFIDPSGHVTGLQERRRTSPRAEDHEAWRRWDAGETGIPGLPSLAPDLQHIGWVVLRVTDIQKEIAFYRDIVGLDVAVDYGDHGSLLSLGDCALLEISAGSEPQPIPADRSEVSNCFILRVHDFDGIIAELDRAGVHFVNRLIEVASGRIAYFTDPEGHLVGIQERFATANDAEDVEARRRWDAAKR